MKKIISIIMVICALFCLTACKGKDNTGVQNNDQIQVENGNNNGIEEVVRYFPKEKLGVYDDKQSLIMSENNTTGYEWIYILGDAEILKIERDKYVADNNEEGLVGAGGNRVIEIVGAAEGSTTIRCEHKRSWEEDAIETVTYYVSVNEELKVAVTDEVHE